MESEEIFLFVFTGPRLGHVTTLWHLQMRLTL